VQLLDYYLRSNAGSSLTLEIIESGRRSDFAATPSDDNLQRQPDTLSIPFVLGVRRQEPLSVRPECIDGSDLRPAPAPRPAGAPGGRVAGRFGGRGAVSPDPASHTWLPSRANVHRSLSFGRLGTKHYSQSSRIYPAILA